MRDLLYVSPASLVVVVITIAMISLIANQMPNIEKWNRIPAEIPSNRIAFFYRKRVTARTLAYLVMFGYLVTGSASLWYLLHSGPSWLDNTIISILFIMNAFVGAYVVYHGCAKADEATTAWSLSNSPQITHKESETWTIPPQQS